MHIPLVFLSRMDPDLVNEVVSRMTDEERAEYNASRIIRSVPFDPVATTLADYRTGDNWYSVEMAVGEDGALFRSEDMQLLQQEFDELASLDVSERWESAMRIVKRLVAERVSEITGAELESVPDNVAFLRTHLLFFLNQNVNSVYRMQAASDMLLALGGISNYPFSEVAPAFQAWPFLVDASYSQSDYQQLLVFVNIHI